VLLVWHQHKASKVRGEASWFFSSFCLFHKLLCSIRQANQAKPKIKLLRVLCWHAKKLKKWKNFIKKPRLRVCEYYFCSLRCDILLVVPRGDVLVLPPLVCGWLLLFSLVVSDVGCFYFTFCCSVFWCVEVSLIPFSWLLLRLAVLNFLLFAGNTCVKKVYVHRFATWCSSTQHKKKFVSSVFFSLLLVLYFHSRKLAKSMGNSSIWVL